MADTHELWSPLPLQPQKVTQKRNKNVLATIYASKRVLVGPIHNDRKNINFPQTTGITCKETWVVGLAMVVPEFQYMVSGYTFALQYGTFNPRPHKFGPHAQDILGTLKDEMKH